MRKPKSMSLKELDQHLDALDLQPVLKNKTRQVRWLYNNGNKCLNVYEEKLVRLMVHRLQTKINELQDQVQSNQLQK